MRLVGSDPWTLFFDNTENPERIDRVFDRIDDLLPQTLVIVVSKFRRNERARNGIAGTEARFKEKGLHFKNTQCRHRVGSDLDKYAEETMLTRSDVRWIGGVPR